MADKPTLRLYVEDSNTVREDIQLVKEMFEARADFRSLIVHEVVEQDMRLSDADLKNFIEGVETI